MQKTVVSLLALICLSGELKADESDYIPLEAAYAPKTADPNRLTLVEYFTANTLGQGEAKVGLDLSYGLSHEFMVGTDFTPLSVGIMMAYGKLKIKDWSNHRVALGLMASYFDKRTALWGAYADRFDRWDVQYIRPSISWTNALSPRLNLHTYWGTGLVRGHANLNSSGRRSLWEAKHPGQDWQSRDPGQDQTPSSTPEEIKSSAISYKALQIQNLTGILKDIFQITGEFLRDDDKKVLITSRVENCVAESLHSNSIRFTAAQQWIFDEFQLRLGLGFNYQIYSGQDWDGKIIEDSGIVPATDIDFYWRF